MKTTMAIKSDFTFHSLCPFCLQHPDYFRAFVSFIKWQTKCFILGVGAVQFHDNKARSSWLFSSGVSREVSLFGLECILSQRLSLGIDVAGKMAILR